MTESIASAAAALADGTSTATALVEESLAAIDAHGQHTNAFIAVDAAGAREAALAVDRERAQGVRRGPLHGIPISLKDLIDVAGVVTTAGSRVLRDRVPTTTATAVTRLRDAGAIIIGRTNLHEFALGTTSDHSAFGPVRNPLDSTRSAGGSSGGSAAAVATGMGLGSIGSDTGGSIRIPAAACGIVGLKPGYGEVPTDGVIPLSPSLDHLGPLTKTVQDAAWIYAVLSGQKPGTVAVPSPLGLRLKRLGGYFAAPLDAAVQSAFDKAVQTLVRTGFSIIDGEILNAHRVGETYVNLMLPEAVHSHSAYLDSRAAEYTTSVHARLLQGRAITAVQYLQARDMCGVLRSEVEAALSDADALILPTLPIVAPPLGSETVSIDPHAAPVPVRTAMLRHTQLFNLTGHPVISLPIETPGLPAGLQLVGRLGSTVRLLEVAAACERTLR